MATMAKKAIRVLQPSPAKFRLCAVVLLMLVVLQNAWVCDDAYISFRMVDNLLNGWGLTWNASERVCTSTHPLWMLLHIPLFLLPVPVFYVSIVLSVVVTLAAALIFAYRVASSTGAAIVGVVILLFSKAFVDYSTSGLENPLAHLLAAMFCWVLLMGPQTPKRFLLLSLLFGLSATNRMDTVLLFIPAMAYAIVVLRSRRWLCLLPLGLLPFIAWELFSIFYYGFPFPNTAYAKLSTGIALGDMARQGLWYLWDPCWRDPLTAAAILLGLGTAAASRDGRVMAIAAGIVLYLLYVVRVGGDSMAGRFLTSPLLLAVIILATRDWFSRRWVVAAGTAAAVILGAFATYPPIITLPDCGAWRSDWVDEDTGIGDSRGIYFPVAGLLNAGKFEEMPGHQYVAAVRKTRQTTGEGRSVFVAHGVGYVGYFIGPHVHVIDCLALGDPLLARLPTMERAGGWRVSHYPRQVPEGYYETQERLQNLLRDADLRLYYDRLGLVIRGSLFDRARLAEIWRLNTGEYDSLLRRYVGVPMARVPLEKIVGSVFLDDPNLQLNPPRRVPRAGLRVDLPRPSHDRCLEISWLIATQYLVVFCKGDLGLGFIYIPMPLTPTDEYGGAVFPVPPAAAKGGYDNIRIYPAIRFGSSPDTLLHVMPYPSSPGGQPFSELVVLVPASEPS